MTSPLNGTVSKSHASFQTSTNNYNLFHDGILRGVFDNLELFLHYISFKIKVLGFDWMQNEWLLGGRKGEINNATFALRGIHSDDGIQNAEILTKVVYVTPLARVQLDTVKLEFDQPFSRVWSMKLQTLLSFPIERTIGRPPASITVIMRLQRSPKWTPADSYLRTTNRLVSGTGTDPSTEVINSLSTVIPGWGTI